MLPKIPKIWGKTQPFWYPKLENWTRLEPITISESSIIWALFSCNRLNLLEIWLWKIEKYTPTEAVSKCIQNCRKSSDELGCTQKHKTQGRIMNIVPCFNNLRHISIWGYIPSTYYPIARISTQTWHLLHDLITRKKLEFLILRA